MNLPATWAMLLIVSQTHVTFHSDSRGRDDEWLSQSGIWGLLKVTAKGHKSRSGACQRNWLRECSHVYEKVKVSRDVAHRLRWAAFCFLYINEALSEWRFESNKSGSGLWQKKRMSPNKFCDFPTMKMICAYFLKASTLIQPLTF